MKLRQLQFVLAIARTRSLSHAAGLCNATQPSVSTALSQLETELGGKLFSRSTRKVDLTPFGRHMMPFLQAIADAETEARSAAEGYHNPARKMLRIGFSPLVDMRRVTSVTDPFRRAAGEIDIFFKECLLDDLSDRLTSGAIDMAILPEAILPEGLDRLPFYADPLVYLPQQDGRAHPDAPLTIPELPPDPVIMTGGGCGLNASLEQLFQQDRTPLHPYPGYAISYPVIQEWTWLGLGAGILPKAKISPDNTTGVRLLRASGATAEMPFFWTWRKDTAAAPLVADFLDFLRHAAPALLAGQHRLVAI